MSLLRQEKALYKNGILLRTAYYINSEATDLSSLQSWLGKLYTKLAFAYQRLVYLYRESRIPNLVEISKARRAGNSAVSSAIELFDEVDPPYIQ